MSTSCRSSARGSPGERIEEAERRGANVATDDTYHSMALSRGASALGVALALGEIKDAPEAAVCRDWSLYSKVASIVGRRRASAQRDRRAGQRAGLGRGPR